MDQETGCPEDYAELFEHYFPTMLSVVSAAGIEHRDVPDVAMDILARFIEMDGLNYYDPEKLHDVGESPRLPGARLRKAKFLSMLRGFTSTYVMQYRDKQIVRHRREPWRTETLVTSRDGETRTWLETHVLDGSYDNLADVEVSVQIIRALKIARAVLIRRNTSTRDYGKLVDVCLRQGLLDGKIPQKTVSAELGVSTTTAKLMMGELRGALRYFMKVSA